MQLLAGISSLDSFHDDGVNNDSIHLVTERIFKGIQLHQSTKGSDEMKESVMKIFKKKLPSCAAHSGCQCAPDDDDDDLGF